jgi:hypothetical protein
MYYLRPRDKTQGHDDLDSPAREVCGSGLEWAELLVPTSQSDKLSREFHSFLLSIILSHCIYLCRSQSIFAVEEWVIYFGKKLATCSARKCPVPNGFSASGTFVDSVQMLLVFLEIG